MTNLTDKWKKGELPFGWYYIKIADIVFIDFFEGKVWKNIKDKYIDEVLAPVPSYEELQNQAFILKSRESENTKLKELLKEWLLFEKEENLHDFTIASERMEELAKQSKELLGEE